MEKIRTLTQPNNNNKEANDKVGDGYKNGRR